MPATARINIENSASSLKHEFSENSESLAAAFEFFNDTSAQLMSSYKALESKINQLTDDLDRVSAEKDEEHLEKNQIATRMQALLDFLPGGVIVLDSRGFIIQSNPAARALLNHPLQGSVWRNVIGECFAPRNDDGLEVSTKSGRRVSISTSSMGEDACGDGQIILLTDLTETRQLQQNLSRTERLSAMGKMVSALAHQIRTPLSAAILYAGHLCNENLDSSKREAFAQKTLSRLHHMERQVRDMLLFVKTELPLNDLVSICDLEQGLREASEHILVATGVSFEWKVSVDSAPYIKCHREALISALVNLINNAVQAKTPDNIQAPYLTIALHPIDNHIRIAISDKGPGMSPELLDSVQDMFVTTKPQGTGLGLAVVKAVAKAHGGKFEIQSESGEGTKAAVLIPIA